MVAIVLSQWHVYATAVRPVDAMSEEQFSPLFARRLEVGIQNMDRPPDKVYMAGFLMNDFGPVETPLSANPMSLCLGSGCFGSGCLGSACLASACFGSACATSKCVGSGCVVSVCGGSACAGSTCVGSACVGSVCVGSTCVGTACVGSACVTCTATEPGGAMEQG